MWNTAQNFGANNVDNNTAFTKPMAQFIGDSIINNNINPNLLKSMLNNNMTSRC